MRSAFHPTLAALLGLTTPGGFLDSHDPATPDGTEHTGTGTGTDVRPDELTCTGSDSDSDSAMVHSPVEVSIDAGTTGMESDAVDGGGSADAVTWTADIDGGTGDFTCDWTWEACDGATSCTIDPPDSDLRVDVDLALAVHDAGECDDETSEAEWYTKYTVVVVSAS